MTRDELREKVADALSNLFLGSQELRGFYEDAADAAIDTIFAALKDPTREIAKAWFNTSGIDFSEDWQAMLSASPLAPEK